MTISRKIALISGSLLLLMTGSSIFVVTEIDRVNDVVAAAEEATTRTEASVQEVHEGIEGAVKFVEDTSGVVWEVVGVIEEQQTSLQKLGAANGLTAPLTEYFYWQTDIALTGREEAKAQVAQAEETLQSGLDTLEEFDGDFVEATRPLLEEYAAHIASATAARASGDAAASAGLADQAREKSSQIQASLQSLLKSASEEAFTHSETAVDTAWTAIDAADRSIEQSKKAGEAASRAATAATETNEATQSVATVNRKLQSVSIEALLASVSIGAILAFIVARSITRPLRVIVDRLKDIAEGDGNLATRIVDIKSRDEIGEIAQSFNTFIETVFTIVGGVQEITSEVAASANVIAEKNDDMASVMERQRGQATQIVELMGGLTMSVQELAMKADESSSTAREAGAAASEGREVVTRTIDGMRSINAAVSSGSESVSSLAARSEEIGRVIEVINEIAEQTNLLALNAAIEAARAGEHGRGFAVVADEVRKLAERTTTATEEVGDSIKAIQTDTSTAVERMESGMKEVDEGAELASQAGERLERIVRSSSSVAGMIDEMTKHTGTQQEISQNVRGQTDGIVQMIEESVEVCGAARETARGVNDSSEKLKGMVERFRLNRRRQGVEYERFDPPPADLSCSLGRVLDLSATGARVRTHKHLREGDSAPVEIRYNGRTVETLAVVRHRRKCGLHAAELGLDFGKANEEIMDILRSFPAAESTTNEPEASAA